MSCTHNLTPEQIRNKLSSGVPFWNITEDMSVEDIMHTFDTIQDVMELNPAEDEQGNSFYTILGHRVKQRVSDLAKYRARKRMDEFTRKNIDKWHDPKVKAAAGTKFHNVMQLLIDAMYNKNGTIADARKLAMEGPFALNTAQFQNLEQVAEFIIKDIEDTQRKIDPDKKAIIRVEQKIYDPVTDRGGTMDLLAIYSDRTGGIFDYKFKSSWGQNYRNNELIDNLMSPYDIADYELNMSEYKRVLMQRHGLKAIRQNRLVPFHLRLKPLPEKLQEEHKFVSDRVELLEGGPFMSDYLQFIPVAGEATKYNGLNKLLDKQWSLLNKLTDRLNKRTMKAEEADRLRLKINTLRTSIQKTIIQADVSDLVLNMSILVNEARNKLIQPKTLESGEPNPSYLSGEELNELIQEFSVYENIIDNTNIFFKDLESKHSIIFKEMKDKLHVIAPKLFESLSDLKMERERRILDLIPGEYKNMSDLMVSLKALPELDFFTANFGRISEIDHPIFQATWKLVQEAINNTRRKAKDLDEEIQTKSDALFQWAKNQGISREEAFNKLIDFEKTNLHSKVTQELLDKINKAYENATPEDAKYLQSVLEIRDKEKFASTYKERLERQIERHKDERLSKEEVERWEAKNNLLKSDEAWVNSRNRGNLKIKDSVANANLSNEYKEIVKHKPLLDYYEMYLKYNKEFRTILGVDSYKKIPPTFIANVRKEMIQHLTSGNSGFRGAVGEFVDSFKVREEDVFIAEVDESGELKRNIPMLFLNSLTNKNGEVDNTRKSYDLSKNLFLFGRMAYNYESMNNIEADIISLKSILADPTSEQEGTVVTTTAGRKVRGKLKEYATKVGAGTDTYQLLEDLTDYYLYGIKFKERSFSKSINTTKLLSSIKQYHSKRSLGFAIIPALGAFIAGKTGTVFEANKGIAYTISQLKDAQVKSMTKSKEFVGLSKYFDVYAEDPLDRRAHANKSNWIDKVFSDRLLFSGLRKADENITDLVINAMAYNFGIDKNGNLVRLNRKGIDTKGIKPIADLFKLDEKTGQATLDISDQTYLGFRNAAKETIARIIGSLSQEDISRVDANLFLNILMHYKSWMPGIVRERFGGLKYDDAIQGVHWGRYKAAFSELSMTKEERMSGYQLGTFFKEVALPNMGKAVLDLMTFGLAPKMGLGYLYGDNKDNMKRIRSNPERAKRRYYEWITENPHLQGKVTFEDFLEIKEAQIRTALMELRTILSFLAFLMFLGGGNDDEEPLYMKNWMTRTMYKTLAKGNSELMFVWSPDEFARLIRNPMPILGILSDVMSTGKNTLDESRDLIFGENSPYDKTPMFYYTVQWAYGGAQMSRFLELFEQYKRSPY